MRVSVCVHWLLMFLKNLIYLRRREQRNKTRVDRFVLVLDWYYTLFVLFFGIKAKANAILLMAVFSTLTRPPPQLLTGELSSTGISMQNLHVSAKTVLVKTLAEGC